MRIIAHGDNSYIYLNGISTEKDIPLREGIVLTPVTEKFHYQKVSDLLKNDVDFAVAAVSGRAIASQLKISAPNAEQCVAQSQRRGRL